jgi:hypothetical protein
MSSVIDRAHGRSIRWQAVIFFRDVSCISHPVILIQNLPNTTQADQRHSRPWHRGLLVDLIVEYSTIKEIWVSAKRNR